MNGQRSLFPRKSLPRKSGSVNPATPWAADTTSFALPTAEPCLRDLGKRQTQTVAEEKN